MILLVNKTRLMKEWTNSRFYNIVAWSAVGIMVALTLGLVVISLRELAL